MKPADAAARQILILPGEKQTWQDLRPRYVGVGWEVDSYEGFSGDRFGRINGVVTSDNRFPTQMVVLFEPAILDDSAHDRITVQFRLTPDMKVNKETELFFVLTAVEQKHQIHLNGEMIAAMGPKRWVHLLPLDHRVVTLNGFRREAAVTLNRERTCALLSVELNQDNGDRIITITSRTPSSSEERIALPE